MDKSIIEVWTKSDCIVNPNHVIINVNNQKIFDGYLTENKLIFDDVSLINGENSLTFELTNKDENNSTLLDNEGKIVKDTFVSIDNIVIEDFMMRAFKNTYGTIDINWAKNKNCHSYLINNNIDIDSWYCGKPSYLSVNARYTFKFYRPLDQWLMKIKEELNPGYVFEQLKTEDQKLLGEVKKLLGER